MTASSRTRSRATLLIVAAMFLGSFGVAAALFFGGWRPESTRNFGEWFEPYRDLRGIALVRADGTPFAWEPARRGWSLVDAPPADCGAACVEMLDLLDRVRRSEGRHADRLQVLWVGELPPGATGFDGLVPLQASAGLQAQLPEVATPQALPVYLADPNGWLVLRYAPGFDPSGLRKDLSRVLK